MADKPRIKLFVIHGWGGSYMDAAARVTDLLEVESYWHNGSFLVPRRRAGLPRHILNEPADDRYITALHELVVSRFMQSPHATDEVAKDADAHSRYFEERLRHDFPRFGIPFGPEARWQRAKQLQADAE